MQQKRPSTVQSLSPLLLLPPIPPSIRAFSNESTLRMRLMSANLLTQDIFLGTLYILQFSCSVAQLCPTLCHPMTAAYQDSLSISNSQNLFKLMCIESVMPSNYLILCRPLLLLPSIFPSIRVFSNESVL